jgi:hypothetical protein
LIDQARDDHIGNIEDMCDKAKQRYSRYRKLPAFKTLLKEIYYIPFAVHLYTKLESGSDKDSAYQNDFYLFKRIS